MVNAVIAQDSWRRVNGLLSHCIWYGEEEEEAEAESARQDVVLCVTGNPGLPDFYREFARKLHAELRLPVCVIGHAGHEEAPDIPSNTLKHQEHKFNLQGQLDHKVELINTINKDVKLHLIGHSIGAWMLLEILNNNEDIRRRTASLSLLFPTLQGLSDTRNGFIVNRLLRNIHSFVLTFVTLVYLLPLTVKTFFIKCYLKWNSLPENYCERILKYINPKVMEKVLFLAYDEMDRVNAFNHEAMGKVKHLTSIIYSDGDGWAPASQIEALAVHQPALQVQKVAYTHAFVLKSSENVGEMVSEFILKQK